LVLGGSVRRVLWNAVAGLGYLLDNSVAGHMVDVGGYDARHTPPSTTLVTIVSPVY
jgi:hypothetical protein